MIVADAAREPPFSVLSRGPGCTIAMVAGDLDIATTPVLRERLFALLGLAGRLLVIDLSGVSFCDAGALAVLIGTQRRARQRGIAVRIAAPSPQVTRLLRITGLDRSFTICATLDEALPARGGPGRRPGHPRCPPGPARRRGNLIPRQERGRHGPPDSAGEGHAAHAAAARRG
jgi:anti-sigma B factor antagonist